MKFKLYLGLFVALLLFVTYFFVSHAYVFMRLTTVLGFMVVVVALMVLLVAFGSRK